MAGDQGVALPGPRLAVLIEDGPTGGDCTFTGCVPSKTLLAAGEPGESFSDAMATVHATVAHIAATEDAATLEREGIQVIRGRGAFSEDHNNAVDGHRFRAPRIVVASGSSAATPHIDGLAEASPLRNESLFDLSEQPEHLLVLGGGPIGCKMAQEFMRLGTRATIIEREDQLLPRDEPEASDVVRTVLERQGVEVRTGAAVMTVGRRPDSGRAVVQVDGVGPREAAEILVSAGRSPVTRGLEAERGPEVAHIGMTETQATSHGGRVAWLPLDEVDRALTSGRTDGFVKLVAGPRRVIGNAGGGRLLGATIVAPRAGEMIHEVALAMRTNLFTGRLAQTVHAYPTWSMAIQEAAAQFFTDHIGRAALPATRTSSSPGPRSASKVPT